METSIKNRENFFLIAKYCFAIRALYATNDSIFKTDFYEREKERRKKEQ